MLNSSRPPPSPAADIGAALTQARALQQAARSGTTAMPLRGRRLALLRADGDEAAADLFSAAVAGLGANVAVLWPTLSEPSEMTQFARVLGRLYDAVDCEGFSEAFARELARGAGIPVFAGLAKPDHASAALVERLDTEDAWIARRRFVVQGMLLAALS